MALLVCFRSFLEFCFRVFIFLHLLYLFGFAYVATDGSAMRSNNSKRFKTLLQTNKYVKIGESRNEYIDRKNNFEVLALSIND